MRDGLLTQDRVRAIQEEIAGFIDAEVLPPTGEFYRKVEADMGNVKKV